MKVRTVKKIIRNGGATLTKSGRAASFAAGYQVSFRDCFTLDASNVPNVCEAINSLLKACNGSEFVGVWVDGGKVFIDLSEWIENRAEAMQAGRERSQLAIFEWATGECIACQA